MKRLNLLLTLMATLAAMACTAVSETETAGAVQGAAGQPAASATPPAAIADETGLMMQNTRTADPTPMQEPTATEILILPVIGPAPGWDNEVWINSDGPLPLEELRGKVVLLEFWTFG
jgi:hypothetical protein